MIRRVAQLLLVLATVSAAWTLRPAAAEQPLDLGVEPAPATFLGCIGRVDRDLASSVAIGSVIRGNVLATLVAPRESSSATVAIDAAGGASVSIGDLGAAGISGMLVELPTFEAGATSVLSRDAAVGALACTPASTQTVVAVGGSTNTGETLDLVLTNPYAADAVVSVFSSSETGADSASEIASVLVPARTTVVRSLETLLSLRQSLTLRMEIQRGAIHAGLIQTAQDDVAVIEAVEPSQDWWLPALSVRESSGRVVVANSSPLPVDIVVDRFQGGIATEAVFEGEIASYSQVDLPVSELASGPAGFRVSADGPVVVGLVIDGLATRAMTPGTTLSTDWVLAGSGSLQRARVWVLNPGEVEAEVILQPLAGDVPARSAMIPADAVVSIAVDPAGAGYLLRSTSELAVFWSARQGGLALATGQPLAVVTE